MKCAITTALLVLLAIYSVNASAAEVKTQSESGATAYALAGSGGGMDDPQTIYRAPSMGIPPSMFGSSNQNCGASETGGISTPWGAIGGSDVQMMLGCNTRADVAILWKMGAHRIAKLLMFCNGRDEVRHAFEHQKTLSGEWTVFASMIGLFSSVDQCKEVRRKPRTIRIGNREVPEPLREPPEEGTRVYHVCWGKPDPFRWTGTEWEYHWLRRGLLQRTAEDAKEHRDALVEVSGGTP